jgi:hypothetical protein
MMSMMDMMGQTGMMPSMMGGQPPMTGMPASGGMPAAGAHHPMASPTTTPSG